MIKSNKMVSNRTLFAVTFLVIVANPLLCAPLPPDDSIPCIIITNNELVDIFKQLQKTKIKRGANTEILTVESIIQKYDGEDDPAKIRNCIRDYYDNKHLEWVILGGDETVVPGRIISMEGIGTPIQNTIIDYYYSCLDGNWNADNDSLYAEGSDPWWGPPDSVDLYPEVAVGRLPFSTSLEVGNFIQKLNKYESGVPYGWQNKVLSLHTRESIVENYLTGLIPEQISLTCLNDENNQRVSLSQYFDEFNSGQNLIMKAANSQHEGNYFLYRHYPYVLIYNDDVDTLSNHDMPSVIYAITSMHTNILKDCMAEHYLKHPTGGSIAYIANAYVDWQFVSICIAAEFFRKLYEGIGIEMGKLLNLGRINLIENGYRFRLLYANRCVILGYQLLGDPQMRIWTDLPKFIRQSQNDIGFSPDPSTLVDTVYDADSGEPIIAATVCLYKPGRIYEVKRTNENGVVAFNLPSPSFGKAYLTAGKPGYVWDERELTISPHTDIQNSDALQIPGPEFQLFDNHPNPFNPSTTIDYFLPSANDVCLTIYNLLGQEVRMLVDEYQTTGFKSTLWDGKNEYGMPVASGVYLYSIKSGGDSSTKKMLLLR